MLVYSCAIEKNELDIKSRRLCAEKRLRLTANSFITHAVYSAAFRILSTTRDRHPTPRQPCVINQTPRNVTFFRFHLSSTNSSPAPVISSHRPQASSPWFVYGLICRTQLQTAEMLILNDYNATSLSAWNPPGWLRSVAIAVVMRARSWLGVKCWRVIVLILLGITSWTLNEEDVSWM